MSALGRSALGLGFRPPHFEALARGRPDGLDYLEIIAENFLGPAAPPRAWLRRVAAHHPVVVHGVSLNLLGLEPLDEAHLDALARLADELDAPFVSEHLCWSASGGAHHHDLLPVPFLPEVVEYAAERAAHAQRRIGRPLALENLSSLVSFPESTLCEWEFHARVVEQSGAWFLLDVNNVLVSAENHGFDPREYLDRVDFSRVLQVHLAGHEVLADGVRVDTHDAPVREEVWALYRYAWERGGPFPTLLERDDRIPPLEELLEEVKRLRAERAGAATATTPDAREPPEPRDGADRDRRAAADARLDLVGTSGPGSPSRAIRRHPAAPPPVSAPGAPRSAPAALRSLLPSFGDALRAPLVVRGGALSSATEDPPPTLVARVGRTRSRGPRDSFALYHRQYWMRLFQTAHRRYPLVTKLAGPFCTNLLVQHHLAAHPPAHRDLSRALEGFAGTLDALRPDRPAVPSGGAARDATAGAGERSLRRRGSASLAHARELVASRLGAAAAPWWDAVAEAAALDEAFAGVWEAPEVAPWTPDGAHAVTPALRLPLRPCVALLEERRPLLEWRRRGGNEGEGPTVPPDPWPEPRRWALSRVEHGVVEVPLEEGEARLLEGLAARSLGEALAELESRPPPTRPTADAVQRWLARAVRLGLFSAPGGDPGGTEMAGRP